MAVVVSHIASDFEALVEQALRQAPLADVIELRLDRIGHPGAAALADAVRRSPKPLLIACPRTDVGGEFTGSVDEQLELLVAAAEAGAHFVDVDASLSLTLGELPGKCHRIVSRHDHDGTPEDLDAFHEEVRDLLYEGDLIKLVTRAHSTEDGLRMLRLLRNVGGGLIAFCEGEAGSFTRLLAPIFGSPFTYAAPAAVPGSEPPEATAPGQIRAGELRALMPPGGLTPETAILGVVGRPVSGSWSPRVHGMALKAAKLDAVYVAFEPERLEPFLDLASDENFRGFSVTAPFKEDAFRIARQCDGAASEARAVNTLVRDGDGWRGMNTDVPAVRETLERAFEIHGRTPGRPVALGAAHVLVLGAGGAARAVVRAVIGSGGRASVAARDAERASALAGELGASAVPWDGIAACEFDALVNATPIGSLSQQGEMPVPEELLREGALVLDAVYRPVRTPLLLAARRRGCTAIPGGEWFVRQASAQFRLFTHTEPDEALMRAAFAHALEDDG